jgi:selenide,water dikinase
MGPQALAQVLQPLKGIFPQQDYPNLLVGLDVPDDSAVYKLDNNRALISTVDFFAPVVDDPYAFGAIAAANALSDVYAMGGKPLLAINLAAFPENFDTGIMAEILRGGAEKVREAGAVIAGGHTITDKEPKYGLAVTGEIHPEKILAKGGAIAGDVLILTKPLGAGVITTALKQGTAEPDHIAAVATGMSRLNRVPAEVAQFYNEKFGKCIHAMTDITGYSLMGHGHEMAHLSNVDLHFRFNALRWYPGALQYAQVEIFSGGLWRNHDYFKQWVHSTDTIADWQKLLLYDPQTSGGLLIAIASERAESFLADIRNRGENAAIIGTVQAGSGQIYIT